MRYLPPTGEYLTSSRSSLISSIPRFDAASISIISKLAPLFAAAQFLHKLHGSASCKFIQFKAFANTLAVVVLPVPLGPQNIYA